MRYHRKMRSRRFFIKADVQFPLGDKVYALKGVDLSAGGIYGVSIPEIDPIKYVGDTIVIRAEVKCAVPFEMSFSATVAAVISTDSSFLEFKYVLDDEAHKKVSAIIAKEGFEPTRHTRKYPRIPANGKLPSMPAHAIVQTAQGLVVFNVANMSPNGILLSSESPRAAMIMPGNIIDVQVEARGNLFNSFEFRGMVRRLEIYRHPDSQNIVYAIGVRFDSFPENNKAEFLEVLKTVVQDLVANSKKEDEDE